ncbi:DUF3516 domain-containing protein, partial [Streptomyces griseus]|uniref:DUF3516 domain-containing protein n=1 Tax=Streptomyces griseus TaxID=1911 RepID=UPI0033D07411
MPAPPGDPAARRDPATVAVPVRKKAPEGFVAWSETTFDKLITSDPEPLNSRF